MSSAEATPTRGIGLPATVWTVIQILGNLWVAYRIGDTIRDLVDHSDPRWKEDLWWYLPTALALSLLAVLALGAVLLRYRAGVIAVIVLAVVSIGLTAYVGGLSLWTFAPLIGVGVLYFLLQPRWQDLR